MKGKTNILLFARTTPISSRCSLNDAKTERQMSRNLWPISYYFVVSWNGSYGINPALVQYFSLVPVVAGVRMSVD